MTAAEKQAAEMAALQELVMHPSEFLRKNSVTPGNAAGGSAAGPANYLMKVEDGAVISRPGSILGNFNRHTGKRFKIHSLAVNGGTPFQAIYIPVQPSNIAFNPYPLNTTGCNLMITTQLSGCCIVIFPGAGTVSVAHLQPTGETGDALRNRLKGMGLKVYGITDYAGFRAAFIGVRKGGEWKFYAQTQDAHFNVQGLKKLD